MAHPHTLLIPRFQTATMTLPGDRHVWVKQIEESDDFSLETAKAGKGGPFGAQLWLVQRKISADFEYRSMTEPDRTTYNDSNAVVSKGIASAHAESENLSPQKRHMIIDFLRNNSNEDWKVVQVSSGESCPSCRTKQILFAEELISAKLIDQDGFYVPFKATYQRTLEDAGFNDAPYDTAFRAFYHLGILKDKDGLFAADSILRNDPISRELIKNGKLIYTPVRRKDNFKDLPVELVKIFRDHTESGTPYAAIIGNDGRILSTSIDNRLDTPDSPINHFEKTAIVQTIHDASQFQRESGIFESWNLNKARLVTNISEIGPLAYAESLWCNLSAIEVYGDGAQVNQAAEELPGLSNRNLFIKAAADYNSPDCPIRAVHLGDPDVPNRAHEAWPGILEEIERETGQNAHYDGTQAEPS